MKLNVVVNSIMNATKEDLVSIHEIGEIMAESLVDYFSNNKNEFF